MRCITKEEALLAVYTVSVFVLTGLNGQFGVGWMSQGIDNLGTPKPQPPLPAGQLNCTQLMESYLPYKQYTKDNTNLVSNSGQLPSWSFVPGAAIFLIVHGLMRSRFQKAKKNPPILAPTTTAAAKAKKHMSFWAISMLIPFIMAETLNGTLFNFESLPSKDAFATFHCELLDDATNGLQSDGSCTPNPFCGSSDQPKNSIPAELLNYTKAINNAPWQIILGATMMIALLTAAGCDIFCSKKVEKKMDTLYNATAGKVANLFCPSKNPPSNTTTSQRNSGKTNTGSTKKSSAHHEQNGASIV